MSKDLPTSAGRETLLTGENKLHQSHISTNIKKEAVILGVLLFNGFLLPSYLSLSYMTFSMTLMIMFSKSETSPIVAKIKKWVSLLMLLVSAVALAVSFYYLISIPVDVKKNLTPDQIRFYISIGISFNQDQSAVNTFVTFLPKIVSMILAYNLVNIYKQNQEDKQQRVCHLTLDLKSRLLNIAVVMICFASCVVQSVVQLFLFIACAFWMASNSNSAKYTKTIQLIISQFCLIFFIFSLPACLYIELQQRLNPNLEQGTVSTFIYPPNTPATAYSIYVSFTIIAFITLSLVEKSKKREKEQQPLVQAAEDKGPTYVAGINGEDPDASFDSENSVYLQVDEARPTYEPLLVRAALLVSVLITAFLIGNVLSCALLTVASTLLFFPIGKITFKLSAYLLMPSAILYFLFFYITNLSGVMKDEWIKEQPYLYYKFDNPTIEIFMMFLVYFLTCKLTSYGGNRPDSFNQANYFQWQEERRERYWDMKSSVCQVLEIYFLRLLGQGIMIGILVYSCWNVTLYNIILLYMCLFYMSMRQDNDLIYILILFWANAFFLADYLTSQFSIAKSEEIAQVSEWMDISPDNTFNLNNLAIFSFDKVIILLILWLRLQLHRYMKYVTPVHYNTASEILQKKSAVLNFIIDSSVVFEKIIFVLTLVGMLLLVTFLPVNIVNWIFLILLFVFLVINFAIKIGEKSASKTKMLNISALVLIIFSCLMIALQTVFQLIMKISAKQEIDIKIYLEKNFQTLHEYSDFYGLELENDREKIIYNFLGLSFFFIGSLILRRALIDNNEALPTEAEMNSDETPAPEITRTQSKLEAKEKELRSILTEKKKVELDIEETTFWYALLEFAEIFHFIWGIAIVALALHWKISLSMFLCMVGVVVLFMKPAFFAYPKRFELLHDKKFSVDLDEKIGSSEQESQAERAEKLGFEKAYQINKCNDAQNELNIVKIRQQVTLLIFAVMAVSIILMYPSELFYRFREKFQDQEALYRTIFYLNWAGLYHRQSTPGGSGQLYDNWGYLFILFTMFIERYLQTQLYNKRTQEVEDLTAILKGEEPSESYKKRNDITLRKKILMYVESKYEALISQTCRQGFECIAIFVCLVSVGYMSNSLALVYLFFAILTLYCYDVEVITYAASGIIIVEYLFQLLNLTNLTSPLGFPEEINDNVAPGSVGIPIDDLANNENFAFDSWLFSMDDSQKNGIWIDVTLLFLLSYYMRVYKLPFNVLIIPRLSKYAVAAIEEDRKKTLEKKEEEIKAANQDPEEIKRIMAIHEEIINHVTPQVEYEEIKKSSSTSRWTLRINYGRILSQHIFVNTFICFLIVLNTSLVSIVSLPIFLYMFSRANDRNFVRDELPGLVKICLNILVADLMIQILMQTPFYNFIFNQDAEGEDGKQYERLMNWIEMIGWRIIWKRDSPASILQQEAFADFVCKCGALCILLLQYYGNKEKDVSWENWEDDVERLYDLHETKQVSMTYKFNNKKVQKIVLNQREKQHREVLIREIENAVIHFDDQEKMKAPLLAVTTEEKEDDKKASFISGGSLDKAFVNRIREAQMVKIKEIENDLAQRDEFIANHTQRLIEEIGWCATTAQRWRNTKSEQILFIYEKEELEKYLKKSKRGLIKVGTELEEALRLDIMDWLLRKKKEDAGTGRLGDIAAKVNFQNKIKDIENEDLENEEMDEEEIERQRKKRDEPQLEDMQRTQTYMETRAGFYELLSAMIEVFVANAGSICCLLMIFCHLINGALLTVFYPIAVFAYALLEETKPQKWFWNIVIYYTIAFVFIRFATQFNFGFEEYLFWMQKYYIGLEPVKEGYQMINYILCEILIICAANLAKMNLDLLGLTERDELQTETVSEAIKRFIENSTISSRIKKALKDGNELDKDDALHIYKEMDSDAPLFQSMSMGSKFQEELLKEKEEDSKRTARQSMQIPSDFKNIENKVKRHIEQLSHREYTQEELDKMEEERKKEDEEDENLLKVGFIGREYFDRLFPSIVEQKPGRDYYPYIFALQIFILIYTLLFWEIMNGNAQSVGEALGSDSLNSEMVTFFMVQMLFMCVDRYLSNVKFTQLKETEYISSKEEINGKELLKNFDITYKPDGDSLMQNEEVIKIAEERREKMQKEALRKKKERESQNLDDDEDHDDAYRQISDGTLQVNKTKLQKALVAKYYFHLVQMVFVHILVFFYLPYRGNYNLHTEIYCDPREDPKLPGVKLYTCNTFTSNTALIIFYMLYVWQFFLAAMQIRYGYPEIRKSNFLMSGNYEGLIKGGDWLFIYTMIPFVMEIKVLLDWTFSKTSLDIYQWFKFVNLHYEVYIFRCGNYEYTKRKTGEPIDVIDKALCGGFFLTLTFTLLLAPLYLFSDLGTSLNPIVGADLNFKMEISNKRGLNSELTLFETNLVEGITTFNETLILDRELDVFFTNDDTKNFSPEQIQEIKMSQYSQQLWGATPPLKEKFVKALSEKDTKVKFTLHVNFDRLAPSNALISSLETEIKVNSEKKQQIYEMISRDCSTGNDDLASVTFPQVIPNTIFLDNTNIASFIQVPRAPFLHLDMTASYSCRDYWVLSETEDVTKERGITFYTFSQKIAPSFLTEYTVFTIYTSFVFLFGQLLRMVFVTGTERLQFQVLTYSDSILVLCEQIIISRRNGRLDREEVLYWTLMEVVRSSEMLRQFTGSNLPENRPHNKERKKLLAAQRAAQ